MASLLLVCMFQPAVAMVTPPAVYSAVYSAVASLVEASGVQKVPLAEVGEHLRAQGVMLPQGAKLATIVSEADELLLTGPPNSRKVGFAADTTESVLVERVSSVLRLHGAPMSSSELRLRLNAERQRVPGLMTLLRTHESVFHVDRGTVRLIGVDYSSDGGGSSAESGDGDNAPAVLTRLRTLSLPDSMDKATLAPLETLDEVIVMDLDNQAFVALERAAAYASTHEGVFILAGCSSAHNPRVPQPIAEEMSRIAEAGRMRLISPARDCANGADFVLAFWVGWLHARTREDACFLIVSEDLSLEQTVADALKGQARQVVSNPTWLEPGAPWHRSRGGGCDRV